MAGKGFSLFLPIEIAGTVNEYSLHFRLENPQFVSGTACERENLVPGDTIIDRGRWED
jgi:hypothetical protein